MKGCPDPKGNPVKAPEVAAGSKKWDYKINSNNNYKYKLFFAEI